VVPPWAKQVVGNVAGRRSVTRLLKLTYTLPWEMVVWGYRMFSLASSSGRSASCCWTHGAEHRLIEVLHPPLR
jgi:hypothetical protein